jgi:NitT/TauT family transport system substrate-binding protein
MVMSFAKGVEMAWGLPALNRFGRLSLFIASFACGVATPSTGAESPTAPRSAATATPKPAPDKVTLLAAFGVTGQDSPFVYALDKGYYSAENIDVEIQPGKGGLPNLQLLAGKSAQFAISTGDSVATAVSRGLPVKSVAAIFRTSPVGLGSLADGANIRTPKDLVGKTMGFVPGEVPQILLPALMNKAGLDPNSVTIANVEFATAVVSLLQKKVDAIGAFSNGGFLNIQSRSNNGAVMLRYANFGVQTIANSVVTTTDTISTKPELVRRFVRATLKGWTEAQKDPQGVVSALQKRFPDGPKPELALQQLTESFKLLDSPLTPGTRIGFQSDADWNAMLDILVQYSKLSPRKALSDYFTNEFLP